ncbi:MAG: hypothetical protein WCV50_06815 [Patescibacteria group bacterium]|jgi:hypothetical protein
MNNKYHISQPIEELLQVFKDQRNVESLASSKEEPRVKIHEAVGKVAYIYEKVRNAVDYQEEHLIRKNAIARMLKRRIMTKERGSVIAEPLIRELIRAGYLKNNFFLEKRIPDIEKIIGKYISLITQTVGHYQVLHQQKKNKTFNWIISAASYEIEEYLSPSIKEDALVECMYKIIRPNLGLAAEIPNDEDRDIQIYIAIHRALIKSDKAMLRYHLIYYYAPEWRFMESAEIPAFAQQLPALITRIEQQISNKMSDRLFRYVKKFAPLFSIIKDVLNQNPDNLPALLQDPLQLEKTIRQACQLRYLQASSKLTRGVIRSIIYIFLTKTLMAFIFELPYETIVLKQVKILPLAINVIFHPFLMFIIATSIRIPAEKNTSKIIQGIYEIVYDPAEKEILKKREETFKTSPVLNVIFTLLYFITFIITFGGIIWLLHTLKFSIVSGFLFVFFLSVISFFGLHLRNTAKELVVVSKRENFFMVIFDFFTLPVVRVGRWIAGKTSKVNVFMFVMDFIIEAPFKVLIETIEDWIAFQRQKKEETL